MARWLSGTPPSVLDVDGGEVYLFGGDWEWPYPDPMPVEDVRLVFWFLNDRGAE